MKVIFNLNTVGIDNINQKQVKDRDVIILSTQTLNSILALITQKYFYNEYQTVKIHSNNFRRISSDYTLYLNYLERNEIIKVINHYIIGKEPNKYMFHDIFKRYAKIHDITYLPNDPEANKKSEYLIPINEKVKKRLSKDFRSVQTINIPILNNKIDIKPDIYDLKSYISSYDGFERIKTGCTYYHWKSGRLNTSFVNCSKNVRLNNFAFNGDKLASLDVPSSFPLFLSIWCVKKGIDITDYEFIKWCSYIKRGRDSNGKSTVYKELRTLLNKMKDTDGQEIYDEKLNAYTKKEKPFYSNSTSKLAFQQWLNGKEKNNVTNNVFKYYFRSMFDIVDRLKFKMYDELVVLETDFIMNQMVAKLYSEIRGIKILTCHDEIYFQDKFKTQVTEIWNEGLKSLYDQLPDDEFDDDDFFDGIEVFD
ncbi:hypothetical protein [uncultured Draconibacterium sp.]|mgnify:CR=1 FL=1|uniref:hypothetical protein n=1 Tax=uncultured Draconibacterium sp. TaxID=1573823 RepID=UPI0025E1F91A|nr:hypothetical protein [uncultured Draconibacterium sp.]